MWYTKSNHNNKLRSFKFFHIVIVLNSLYFKLYYRSQSRRRERMLENVSSLHRGPNN